MLSSLTSALPSAWSSFISTDCTPIAVRVGDINQTWNCFYRALLYFIVSSPWCNLLLNSVISKLRVSRCANRLSVKSHANSETVGVSARRSEFKRSVLRPIPDVYATAWMATDELDIENRVAILTAGSCSHTACFIMASRVFPGGSNRRKLLPPKISSMPSLILWVFKPRPLGPMKASAQR